MFFAQRQIKNKIRHHENNIKSYEKRIEEINKHYDRNPVQNDRTITALKKNIEYENIQIQKLKRLLF